MMRSGSERIRSMRGLMAERLRTGLQIREARFDSGSGLHTFPKIMSNSKSFELGKADWPPELLRGAIGTPSPALEL